MVDRIKLILGVKNLTPRQFADEIGIQPSGMSHILSGRNNPSLDFVMKVVNRYPEIDIKWLTLGKGEMFVGAQPKAEVEMPREKEKELPPAQDTPQELDLFSAIPSDTAEQQPNANNNMKPATASLSEELPQIEEQQPESEQKDETSVIAEPIIQQAKEETAPVQGTKTESAPVQRNEEEPNTVVIRQKKVVKVVFFYDNHTFEEYFPD